MENLTFEEMQYVVGGTNTTRLPNNPGQVTLPFVINEVEE